MSNYVYMGATPLVLNRAGLLPQAAFSQLRAFTPIKPLSPEDLDAAQMKALIAKNRTKITEEIRKKGMGDKVTVLADGSLQLRNPMNDLDAGIANLLKQNVPVWGIDFQTGKFTQTGTASAAGLIDRLPFLNATQKTQLKRAPLSFMMSGFDPLIDFFGDAFTEVMEKGLSVRERAEKTAKDKGFDKGGYVYDLSGFPFFMGTKGRAVNIALVQPGDDLFEPVSRRQIKSFRTVFAFIVLYFKKWFELHKCFALKFLDFVAPEEKFIMTSTEGKENNTRATALVVDELPYRTDLQIQSETLNDRLGEIWSLDGGTGKKKTYYKFSPRGQYDRNKALQEDWDDKYGEYEKDFCFWHVDAAARVNWLKLTKGMSESAARRQVAGEYGLKRRFSTERNLPTRFRVNIDVPKRLAGGEATVLNGDRPEVRGPRPAPRAPLGNCDCVSGYGVSGYGVSGYNVVDGLSALGSFGGGGYVHTRSGLGLVGVDDAAIPAAVAEKEAEVLILGMPVAAFVGLVLGVVTIVVTAVLAVIFAALGFCGDADLSKGKIGWRRCDPPPPPTVPPSQPPPPTLVGPPDSSPPGGGGGGGAGTQSESASGGFPVVPVALAAGLALLLLSRR